ncbi:MAG: GspE/PulE family protein [Rhodothermia bacterium]|nr:MAG: GspE/PulE family protein [Rhodothermia bacterium]
MEQISDKTPDFRNRAEDRTASSAKGKSRLEAIRRKVAFETVASRDRVVTRLLDKGAVNENHLVSAWEEWNRLHEQHIRVPFWRLLTIDETLDAQEIYSEAASVYAFKQAGIDKMDVLEFIAEHREKFNDEIWEEMVEAHVLPVGIDVDKRSGENIWIFATHDPTRPEVHQLIQTLQLKRFELRYSPLDLLGSIISDTFISVNQYLEKLEEVPPVFDMGMDFIEDENSVDDDALEAEINRSRLINLFEASLVEAVKRGASDIHIFPNDKGEIELQMRIDGELEMWHIEDGIRPESFLSVVKDNSMNVDRFERDSAQDGYIQRWIDEVLIRFRVSVLPIASAKQEIHAESVVIRVLDDRKVITDLGKIGLLGHAMERFDHAIRQPNGMVILTGPTGSGKSTTLVAALSQVVTSKVNVLTIEDPVEYLIKGVRQIKLGVRLGLESALRAILRHDPDIVMVGEMRDRETAELAIKLANTGHLTFTTLHTNDAPSAVSRLFKMGIEPFLISYAINLVVAQRLVRKLCNTCKRADVEVENEVLRHLGFTETEIGSMTIYTQGDDTRCGTCKGSGYKGRRAVAETLTFTPAIRSIIMESGDIVDESKLRDKAIEEGMLTLSDCARRIVIEGETSIDEMLRVTGSAI